MKKLLLILTALIVCLSFAGCYDMTEIEDIKTVSVVCVENGKITYCTITTSPEEKKYGFELYPIKTEDLYEGLNSISVKSGKEISVSHLGAIMFKKDCPPSLIRSVCTSAIGGSEFHPKVMTAFVDMDFDEFFEKMSVPADSIMYKKITDVLNDRYAAATECTVMDLYHGIMHETLGVNMPVISLDEDGNIVIGGSGHISGLKVGFIDKELTDTVNLLENSGKPVYYKLKEGSVAAKVVGGYVNFDKEKNHIYISLDIGASGGGKFVSDSMESELEERIYSDVIKICNQKNNGFDILHLNREMLKKFKTENSFDDFKNSKGGFSGMMKSLDFDIEIRAKDGDV